MALIEAYSIPIKEKSEITPLCSIRFPTRMDIGKIRVDFESSYEESGPFEQNLSENL